MDKFEALTPRERDVLAAILDGDTTDKELQQRLNLSRSTIAKHLVHIYRKIGVFGRTGLVIEALREQWLAEEAGEKNAEDDGGTDGDDGLSDRPGE